MKLKQHLRDVAILQAEVEELKARIEQITLQHQLSGMAPDHQKIIENLHDQVRVLSQQRDYWQNEYNAVRAQLHAIKEKKRNRPA